MLKQLRLRKQLELLRVDEAGLLTREVELKKRTDDLAQSIQEAQNDDDLTLLEKEEGEVSTAKETLEAEKASLTEKIKGIEDEITELDKKSNEPAIQTTPVERKGTHPMLIRSKFFKGLERSEVEELIKREESKGFIEQLRSFITQKRAVTGGDLTIPVVFLEMLRDNLDKYSKLIKYVNRKVVAGTARQTVAGTIPEAVWTEMIASLNELAISFNQIEVDGYKVGGYIALPNSLLKDSDLNLINEAMFNIAQAIGFAVDKAILYGTGSKMPVGIVKRLAEAVKPGYWGTNEKTWTDLHTTNLLAVADTEKGAAFYEVLITALGVIKNNYALNGPFWAMNRKTKTKLVVKAISMNAAGAIVTGQQNTMPIIGGDIVELDFIPADVIIGGFGDLYLLAEREGAVFATSDQVKFIEDNTVVKGIARMDGRPVFGEAFVAVHIGTGAPVATDVTFVTDSANA
jgi:HK97 family phage major capsid protein